jgi:hypothetical protein
VTASGAITESYPLSSSPGDQRRRELPRYVTDALRNERARSADMSDDLDFDIAADAVPEWDDMGVASSR